MAYDGEDTPRRREITRDALMFTLLTWARTSETRFATWDEFENLDGAQPLWRLSPERMKMDREHLVALPRQAVELLRRRRRSTNSDYLFPGAKHGKPISENTMIYACYRMGDLHRQTVHQFRGIASTWANEAECYKPDWIEMALAHEDENEVRSGYNSALYLAPRRRMLQSWADMIENSAGTSPNAIQRSEPSPVSIATSPTEVCKGRRLPPASQREPYWQRSKQVSPAWRKMRVGSEAISCRTFRGSLRRKRA